MEGNEGIQAYPSEVEDDGVVDQGCEALILEEGNGTLAGVEEGLVVHSHLERNVDQ